MKTVGQIMLADVLPEDLKHYADKTLDKKKTKQLFTELAQKHPEQYNKVLSDVGQMSFRVVSDYGRQASPGLSDMEPPKAVQQEVNRIRNHVDKIKQSPDLTPDEKTKKVFQYIASKEDDLKKKLLESGTESNNAFVLGTRYGWKANPDQVAQLLVGDLINLDVYGNPSSVPGLHSYTEGPSSEEQMAAAPGSMAAMASVQESTKDAGYLAKQIAQTVDDQKVTGQDCGTKQGILGDTSDPDNFGRVLQEDVDGVPAGTVIDDSVASKLHGKKALMRSPLTCSQRFGLCQSCVGKTEEGRFPHLGEHIGITTASSSSEPITQAGLCLHPDTEVRMADWFVKKIKDISPGEYVLGANKDRKTFPVKVKNVYYNGKKDVYRFTFRKGSSNTDSIQLDCTEDHKMIGMSAECNKDKGHLHSVIRILPVDYRSKSPHVSAVLHDEFDDTGLDYYKEALLLGLLLGDGCYTESVHSVNFSCADHLLVEELEEYLNSLELKLHKLGTENYWKVSSTTAKSGLGKVKNGYTNYARKRLYELGMLNKYAHEKIIPREVYSWDNQSIAELISGLFITDGSIYKQDTIEFYSIGSTSRKLMVQVKDLLEWRFGIYTTAINGNSSSRKRTLWTMVVSCKHSVYKMRDVIRWRGIKRSRAKIMCIDNNTKCLDKFNETVINTYRCKRIGKEYLGQLSTMDIEVDHPDHLFVLANGMCVSNSSKHSGKIVGSELDMTPFEEINQMYQVSKSFKGAELSPEEGKVTSIKDAPQGGKHVKVNNQEIYVSPDKEILVSEGEDVEQGDRLTEGDVNPKDYARYKGLGEGRRKFAEQQYDVFHKHGLKMTPRQSEILARGFINHARITDPEGIGGIPPGKTVTFSELQDVYQPREHSVKRRPETARHKYLEEPVLHYSIGTKITPRIAQDLKHNWNREITVHDQPPGFEPVVQRASNVASISSDWKTRLSGFGIHDSFKDAAQKGSTSPRKNKGYIAELMDPLGMRHNLSSTSKNKRQPGEVTPR